MQGGHAAWPPFLVERKLLIPKKERKKIEKEARERHSLLTT
jgi:hypothetical protein